jgi:hypothetical protein
MKVCKLNMNNYTIYSNKMASIFLNIYFTINTEYNNSYTCIYIIICIKSSIQTNWSSFSSVLSSLRIQTLLRLLGLIQSNII